MVTKPVIAAFDFDDTLIGRNTLPDFIRFSASPKKFILRSGAFLPTLVRFSMRRISNQQAKERLLTTFYKGMSNDMFLSLCERYADRLEVFAQPAALDRLKWHQERGDETAIVSASVEDWIKPWAARHGIEHVIATKLERKSGKLTGQLVGKNCHGPEKVQRFLAVYPRKKSYTLYAYGDGKSDQELFKLADKVFEKRFE